VRSWLKKGKLRSLLCFWKEPNRLGRLWSEKSFPKNTILVERADMTSDCSENVVESVGEVGKAIVSVGSLRTKVKPCWLVYLWTWMASRGCLPMRNVDKGHLISMRPASIAFQQPIDSI